MYVCGGSAYASSPVCACLCRTMQILTAGKIDHMACRPRYHKDLGIVFCDEFSITMTSLGQRRSWLQDKFYVRMLCSFILFLKYLNQHGTKVNWLIGYNPPLTLLPDVPKTLVFKPSGQGKGEERAKLYNLPGCSGEHRHQCPSLGQPGTKLADSSVPTRIEASLCPARLPMTLKIRGLGWEHCTLFYQKGK